MNNFDNYLQRIIHVSPTKEDLVENIKILFEIEHLKRLNQHQLYSELLNDIDNLYSSTKMIKSESYLDEITDELVECYSENSIEELFSEISEISNRRYYWNELDSLYSYELQLENRLYQQQEYND